ncbi:hypothetical protein BHQ31_27575 [Burkholderia cenocepacia]|nr:hypothetical protein BHQ31_27575 [Burkholderia cenocepacia]
MRNAAVEQNGATRIAGILTGIAAQRILQRMHRMTYLQARIFPALAGMTCSPVCVGQAAHHGLQVVFHFNDERRNQRADQNVAFALLASDVE